MKKCLLSFLLCIIGCASGLYAQAVLSQDNVLTLDSRSRDYREGEVLVKFRDATQIRVRQNAAGKFESSGVNAVDAALAELGIAEMEELMPLTGRRPAPKKIKAFNGKDVAVGDMSRLYRVRLNTAQRAADAKPVSVPEAVARLSALADVEYAEPNYLVYTLSNDENETTAVYTDPLGSQQWGLRAIDLLKLWKVTKTTEKRPVIAIIDTGVDIEHPDLADNIWTNLGEANGAEGHDDDDNGFTDDLHGWDFVNQTGNMDDFNGHGTHCAGIAAAVGNNKIGIAGANPDALIMPITVMQSDGVGDVATIIRGIDYAAANGADIISMSLGGYAYSMAEEQALARAYNSAVIVAAAGNDNRCIYPHKCPVNNVVGAPMYPAAFTFVLGVEASDNRGNLATFSNYDEDGPLFFNPEYFSEEQMYNYELRAPGVGIYSTYPNGQYKTLSGTSMACPLVAGAISRLLQCKEYANNEVLFGDLIHTRDGDINIFEAYNITDADRKPTLSFVTYELQDTINGDGDQRPDNSETIEIYPTLRNAWGQANNVRMWMTVGENEDETIVTFLTDTVQFGYSLSGYGKTKAANPIKFTVRDNCVDGRHIKLRLHATCDNIEGELVHDFTITVENGVEIGGMITEDMTLYPGVSYIVTNMLAIPQNVTLTIKPGTVIKFKDNTGLKCEGHLVAKGTPDSLITFTKTDLGNGSFNGISCTSHSYYECNMFIKVYDTLEYVIVKDFYAESYLFSSLVLKNSVTENINMHYAFDYFGGKHINSTITGVIQLGYIGSNEVDVYKYYDYCNINFINNYFLKKPAGYCNDDANPINIIGNTFEGGNLWNSNSPYGIISVSPKVYFGSNREDIIRRGVYDINSGYGFGHVDLTNRLARPNPLAPPVVWKVNVNGYDSQDEFDSIPPLGVGRHKFEVYYSQPVDTTSAPMIAMGVRPPYTSTTIAEDGSWNETGDIYTAYLTITGKMAVDGLNRIYVSGGKGTGNFRSFDIPYENSRYNVMVQAAGSMSAGFAAETGIGKVMLEWDTQDENVDDILGFNLYRYRMDTLYNRIDSMRLNTTLIENTTTEYTDYDVVPGETYYYYYKILRTSLTENSPSRVVAATPLTAIKGDANGSMGVDVADVVTEIGFMTGQNPQPFILDAADVNFDGIVNILDVVATINIILHPTASGIASLNSEAATYYVENGILYVNTPVALGGLQFSIDVPAGTNITMLDALDGFEHTSSENDGVHTYLVYSMSGRTLAPGTHALLRIGDGAVLNDIVLSDPQGRNVVAIQETSTGLSDVTMIQIQRAYPNPFTNAVTIDYAIGNGGSHAVELRFTDISGRVIDSYRTSTAYGNHTYTWNAPNGLTLGVYFVTLYVDGHNMQTWKLIHI